MCPPDSEAHTTYDATNYDHPDKQRLLYFEILAQEGLRGSDAPSLLGPSSLRLNKDVEIVIERLEADEQ